MSMKAGTRKAYKLLLEGQVALAEVESHGVRVDLGYLDTAIAGVDKKVATIETRMTNTDVWKAWKRRFGEKANLASRPQLAVVLFQCMGFKSPGLTVKGRTRTDKAALEDVNHPVAADFIRKEELKKLKSTYLLNLKRELVGDRFHPAFHLHTASSFRSSSGGGEGGQSENRDLNFQNLPIRDPERGEIIRRCFIADYRCRITEDDLQGAEVRANACYNKDPALIRYVEDPDSDMHADTARKLFLLKADEVDKKGTRDATKNMFVFAQFYGSYYLDCAKMIWRAMLRRKFVIKGTDKLVIDHLKEKGIGSLGACDEDSEPEPGTFEHHCRKVERWLWEKRFPTYANWRREWYEKYKRCGYFDLLTGFRLEGYMRRNQVICIPAQGTAFHIELLAIIMLLKEIRKRKMKARVVGQIHDSTIGSVPDEEVDEYHGLLQEIITERIPNRWDWINVPLKVEAEHSPVGGSWYEKGRE